MQRQQALQQLPLGGRMVTRTSLAAARDHPAGRIKGRYTDPLKRAEERELDRKLSLQLIDIGYKALVSRHRPRRDPAQSQAHFQHW
jgi:hypothetical protein